MFLFFGFAAAQIANLSGAGPLAPDTISTSNLLFIATAFGLSLLTNAWLYCRVSGAIFNPAVSFALVLARVISPLRGLLVSIAQVGGGITAAGLIRALTSAPLDVSSRLGPNISPAQGIDSKLWG
jgi:aquaporin rerated protein, other eukaryote